MYTAQYFIDKFEGIPEELWCCGEFTDGLGRFCAMGFCGRRLGVCTDESFALSEIFIELGAQVPAVNDGDDSDYQQETPKQRILAALRDIQAKGG
jgi:hypothetical protein